MKKGFIVIAIVVGAVAASSAAGTALSIVFGTPTVVCPEGNVAVEYTISTTAADGATVTEKLTDSSNATITQSSYDIQSGNVAGGWTFGGTRTKTHDDTFEYNGLSNGTYSLQVCVMQAGSGSNPAKTVCNSQTIVVDCSQIGNPCANTAPFGEVVGNTKIGDHATVQINFEGDFGASAMVEIRNADSFYAFAWINKNGDSCNYHANWKLTTPDGSDFYGSAGAGVYTVTVTGNGATLQFPVTLSD
jgi:hypothetical protein